jgi:hypothetical protein
MFLKNTYKCKRSLIKKQYVDCVHWSVDSEQCLTHCSLNVLNNPTASDCSKCPKRQSYKVKEISESKEINLPKQEDKSLVEKVKDYVKAEGSQAFMGKVSQEVYEKRKEICMGCEFRVAEAKDLKDEIGWCKGGCGCAVGNPRAALSQKLYMPALKCPKKKFGVEQGVGFNIKDSMDSVKGLATSIKNNIQEKI